MDIINGLDGQYIVMGGKLLKIVGQRSSEKWFTHTSGWLEYTLEDGQKIMIGNDLP